MSTEDYVAKVEKRCDKLEDDIESLQAKNKQLDNDLGAMIYIFTELFVRNYNDWYCLNSTKPKKQKKVTKEFIEMGKKIDDGIKSEKPIYLSREITDAIQEFVQSCPELRSILDRMMVNSNRTIPIQTDSYE